MISPGYMKWRTEAGWMLKNAKPKPFGKMKVQVVLWVPRKPASRDIDNFAKAPIDLLVAHGVIDDDKHIEKLTIERHDEPDALLGVMPFAEAA